MACCIPGDLFGCAFGDDLPAPIAALWPDLPDEIKPGLEQLR